MAFNLDNYEDVASRVKRFQEAYPMGRIYVKVLDFDKEKGSILVEASVYRTDTEEMPAAIDIAMEWAKKSSISEKWWVENAATSAIGRAISSVLPTETKATRESMAVVNEVAKAKVDPWAVYGEETKIGTAVEQLQDQLGGEILSESPICAHGHMLLREGSKPNKEGIETPYKGYVCPEKKKDQQCKPKWMVWSKTNAEWRFQ